MGDWGIFWCLAPTLDDFIMSASVSTHQWLFRFSVSIVVVSGGKIGDKEISFMASSWSFAHVKLTVV